MKLEKIHDAIKNLVNDDDEVDPEMVITAMAGLLGWGILLCNPESDDEVEGLAVGTDKYLDEILPMELAGKMM